MLAQVNARADFPQIIEMQKASQNEEKSSLFGRISINWDKTLLFCNSALVLCAVAYAFFIKLPAMGFALLGYGIFQMMLYTKAVKQRPSEEQIAEFTKKLQFAESQIQILEEKIKILDSPEEKANLQKIKEELGKAKEAKADYVSQAKQLKKANIDTCLKTVWESITKKNIHGDKKETGHNKRERLRGHIGEFRRAFGLVKKRSTAAS